VLARHEEVLQGRLSGQLGLAQAKVAEARQLMHEARREAWKLTRLGVWIQNECDEHGVFAGQPAPTGEEPVPPESFDADSASQALSRPWHREKLAVEPVDEPLDEGDVPDLGVGVLPLDAA
jgi:hypothetical protein